MEQNKKATRLNSFLSRAGIAARRKCDLLIKKGLVSVNGTAIREPGFRVHPERDCVVYKSSVVKPVRSFSYMLLNKPRGIVTTVRDQRKRPTVIDLIESERRLFPVGRLDINTTGLLLITDDGELSYRLTHPRYRVEKVYTAGLHKSLTEYDRERLERGVIVGKKKLRAKISPAGSRNNRVHVYVHEGPYRMIRRMFNACGYIVTSLDRIRYAGLTKKKLPRGGWRYLTPAEVKKLYELTGQENGY